MPRTPRAARNGEEVLTTTTAELAETHSHGRIVQLPGQRGYLRGVWPRGEKIAVATTTGIADYLPNDPVLVWGP